MTNPEPLPFVDGANAVELAEPCRVETIQPIPSTPMGLIQMALQSGSGMETIERLVALQNQERNRESEMAFNAAMTRAQAAMGTIQADLTNPQTKSKYVSHAALDRRVRPIYSAEGLALSFDTADCPLPEHVRILCYVSHAAGHTRTYHNDMPNDGKGAKGGDVMTKTHATGAAMSYGMRYLLKMIFNIAVGEDDRDGNEFGVSEPIFQGHLKAVREAKDIETLQRVYEVAKAGCHGDKPTLLAIAKAKDERKGELRGSK